MRTNSPLQTIKEGLESSGYKPEVQPLKYFEDDYGLKVGDDDEEDDDDEDEDEDDEEYETGSEEGDDDESEASE